VTATRPYPGPVSGDLERRIAALEREVVELRELLADTRRDTAMAHELLAIDRRYGSGRHPDLKPPEPPA
jgi:hypothetical protein